MVGWIYKFIKCLFLFAALTAKRTTSMSHTKEETSDIDTTQTAVAKFVKPVKLSDVLRSKVVAWKLVLQCSLQLNWTKSAFCFVNAKVL